MIKVTVKTMAMRKPRSPLVATAFLITALFAACGFGDSSGAPHPDSYAPLEARDLSLANTAMPALVKADLTAITTDLGGKTIPWLVDCSKKSYLDLPGYGIGDLVYRRGAVSEGSKIDAFFETPWLCRAMVAYMQTKHLAAVYERAQIEEWFYENAVFTLEHMQSFLRLNFPDREAGDYSNRKGDAKDPARYIMDYRTTLDGDRITGISQWYNNRRAMSNAYLLLAGIAFRNARPEFSKTLLDEVKRYVKEWVIYSTYPTGETGEWARNHSYPNEAGTYIEGQGVTYNAYNSALALLAAQLLYEKCGDRELLDFSTRDGLFGTECEAGEPAKTIWTASDLHIDLLTGHATRVNHLGAEIQVIYDYPDAIKRNELRHASWYLPAYRSLSPSSEHRARIEAWMDAIADHWDKSAVRADDSFGRGRGFLGLSRDIRTEDWRGISPL